MINVLLERWRPETYIFHFSVGECAVTLEDVVIIFGLSTNGLPDTGSTMSNFEALEAECLHQFGIAPKKIDCRGSFIKLTWYNWDRENYAYRYHSLVHYRRLLDDLQEGHAYDIERIESDVISLDIRHHSIIWSATVRLYFSNASSGMHSIKLGGNLV
ncbi:uncharacterized protein DS421_3g67850 [Arachis hypogaea]|nr:uncharacterized protein DS421_3g67850 [Arachis hypogaea]